VKCRPVIKGGAFSYPGGSTRNASLFVRMFPKHRKYVEPFVGGGSVFLAHPLCGVSKSVINDKDKLIANLFKQMKSGEIQKLLDKWKCVEMSQELFDKYRDSDNPLERLAFYRMSFSGFIRSPSFNKGLAGKKLCFDKLKRLAPKLNDKLANTSVTSQDFKTTIRNHDGKDTFFFFDPPWAIPESKRMYKHHTFDWTKFAKSLSNIVGKFMVYNRWNDEIATVAQKSGLRVYRVKARRKPKKGTQAKHVPHESTKNQYMIITNYPIQKGKYYEP